MMSQRAQASQAKNAFLISEDFIHQPRERKRDDCLVTTALWILQKIGAFQSREDAPRIPATHNERET